MRNAWRLLFSLMMSALAGTAAAAPRDGLTVMSFNVRLPAASDGPDEWGKRRALFLDTIAREAPDIIGTQELFFRQGQAIVDAMPHYGWVGIGRRGDHGDEHMGLFYRRDRLKLVEFGDFWLSDTPEVPGSISWGNLYPRMVTWGLFEPVGGGRRFMVFNTHFPYRAEDEAAREKAARLLADRIAAVPADLPVILTGDFNTTPDTPSHALLAGTLADAWTHAAERSGPEGTFHGFTGRPGDRIDWIFTRGFTVESARTVDTHRRGHYPSDHFPVVVRLAP